MTENLKIVVHFLFGRHTTSVYLLISALSNEMAKMEMDYNVKTFGERFQALCLYLAKIVEKLIMVCTPYENSLDIFFVFQEHFVSKQRHLIKISEVSTTRDQNPRDTTL